MVRSDEVQPAAQAAAAEIQQGVGGLQAAGAQKVELQASDLLPPATDRELWVVGGADAHDRGVVFAVGAVTIAVLKQMDS